MTKQKSDITTSFKVTFAIPFAILCLAFPIAMVNVFILGGDRQWSADFLAIGFVVGFYGMFLAPWLPVSGLAGVSKLRKLEITVTIWLWAVYLTALIWELPYLLFTDAIRGAKDQMWAYTWWAYIDGGDFRYAGWDPTIVTLEAFTIINAFVGLYALRIWLKSNREKVWPLFVFMFTGASHSYQTMLYFVSQNLVDYADVGATWFDLYVRFHVVNSPWVVMPLFVWWYCYRKVNERLTTIPIPSP